MKSILLIIFVVFFLLKNNMSAQSDSLSNNLSDSIVLFAKQFIGVKYMYACASAQKGFDCSGFVNYVYKNFNINVPRSSRDFLYFGKTIHIDSCRAGDVIVFKGTNASNSQPGHVGIVTVHNQKELFFIHSSSDKKHSGIKISDYNAYENYKKRFIKVIRVL